MGTLTALVRRPGPRLADGITTHIERREVDLELAHQQWSGYVAALAANGWRTVEVPPADDSPDAVFVEDALVVLGDLAVVTRHGAETRRVEIDGAARAASAEGLRLARIEPPGTLDGGDVLKVATTVYVGIGGRTNESGLDQLAAHLEPLGARVVPVPTTRVLHLKSAVTALPDGTIIGYPPLVDDPAAFASFRSVPEPEGAHVVLLGTKELLIAASAPRSTDLLQSLGYEPVVVDISEFEKLEGCVTCLSVRLRG